MKNATYKGWYLFYRDRQWHVSKAGREIGPFLIRDRAKEWVDQQPASNPMKKRKTKRSHSTGTRVKAAARKITAQIKKLKTKRRQLYR